MKAVEVSDLRVELVGSGADIVDEIAFDVAVGEIVGIVGESGSGKTTVGTALLNGVRRGARVAGGLIRIDGRDLHRDDMKAWQEIRGSRVSYVPQDPSAMLNPSLRIRRQLDELFDAHEPKASREERQERIASAFAEAKLPADSEFLKRFPHQLSGGQLQRVCLAIAFLLRPRLIVLDEPTTGLDVTTQAHVLETVKTLCAHHSVGALYITHDLAVVANVCDRVLVMYAGRIVESGPVATVFRQPSHPYTRELLDSVPDLALPRVLHAIEGYAPRPGERPPGCPFSPRCRFALPICETEPPVITIGPGHVSRCHRVSEIGAALHRPVELQDRREVDRASILRASNISAWYGESQVLHDVSIGLGRGECLAIVGESGSGKTTLARVIVGLLPSAGEVTFRDEALASQARKRTRTQRQELQYVFQSPYSSLNPRHTVKTIIEGPLNFLFDIDRAEAARRAAAALEMVSLPPSTLASFQGDLSGGERQRVAIARALACEPTVMICDEITSALDVSVQAGIVELLERLRRELHLSLLFVTHNLALVRTIADRVTVLQHGRCVEVGTASAVLDSPTDDYTKQLLSDSPSMAHRLAVDPADAQASAPTLAREP